MKAWILSDEQIIKLYAKATAKAMTGEIPRDRFDKVMKWVSLFTTEKDDLMRVHVVQCLIRNREFPDAVADTINNIVCYEDNEEEIADWVKHGGDENVIRMMVKGRRK